MMERKIAHSERESANPLSEKHQESLNKDNVMAAISSDPGLARLWYNLALRDYPGSKGTSPRLFLEANLY